ITGVDPTIKERIPTSTAEHQPWCETGGIAKIRQVTERSAHRPFFGTHALSKSLQVKKSWLEITLEPARWIFWILRQLSTDGSNDDGGGGNIDARRTNRMTTQNSRSTDTVGSRSHNKAHSSHTDNTHNSSEIRPQFRPTRQRQNAVRERKPVPLPPMQLREVFSCFTS